MSSTFKNLITKKPYFKSRNYNSAKLAYNARLKYVAKAYADFEGDRSVLRSFIMGEHIFHGRLQDLTHVPMIVRKDVLMDEGGRRLFAPLISDPDAVSNTPDSGHRDHKALKFVSFAFNEMMKEFRRAKLDRRLIPDEKYHSIGVFAGFRDPRQKYKKLLHKVHYQALASFIMQNDLNEKIYNFKTFLTCYYRYLDIALPRIPMTLSGWIKSRQCDPQISGLSIKLASSSATNDMLKVQNYINSPNFCFFASAAKNYGFVIDKDIPWKIVADLKSPAMKKYILQAVPDWADSLPDLQNRFYIPAHYEGYAEFRNFAFTAYNAFVTRNPIITVTFACANGQIKRKQIKRMPIKPSLVTSYSENSEYATGRYDEAYWIEKYIYYRNVEEGGALSEPLINKLTIDMKNLLQSKSVDVILNLIEIKFADTYKDPGSLRNRLDRIRGRREAAGTATSGAPSRSTTVSGGGSRDSGGSGSPSIGAGTKGGGY